MSGIRIYAFNAGHCCGLLISAVKPCRSGRGYQALLWFGILDLKHILD